MAKVNENQIQLESFLREKIREAIAEHFTTLNEWDPEEWDETAAEHMRPENGEVDVDPATGERRVWNDKMGDWVDEKTWASLADPEYDMSGSPMPELTPQDPDPEPLAKGWHLSFDDALNLEFADKKQIQMENLDKMIKESVKRYFKENK